MSTIFSHTVRHPETGEVIGTRKGSRAYDYAWIVLGEKVRVGGFSATSDNAAKAAASSYAAQRGIRVAVVPVERTERQVKESAKRHVKAYVHGEALYPAWDYRTQGYEIPESVRAVRAASSAALSALYATNGAIKARGTRSFQTREAALEWAAKILPALAEGTREAGEAAAAAGGGLVVDVVIVDERDRDSRESIRAAEYV